MTREQKQEYTLKITQANKTQMIVILYEMALIYMKEAQAAIDSGNRTEFKAAVNRTRGCINELLASLHFEYEMAMNLLQLYLYVNKELARAEFRGSAEPIQNAEKVIRGLHQAYQELGRQDTSAPVMMNTQSVYAGLTYGRSLNGDDLLESLTNHSTNRGFCV